MQYVRNRIDSENQYLVFKLTENVSQWLVYKHEWSSGLPFFERKLISLAFNYFFNNFRKYFQL